MANIQEAFDKIESKLPPLTDTNQPNKPYINNIYITAVNDFALRIQRYLAPGCLSSFAVSFIMSLIYVGARANTRAEIGRLLSIQSGINTNDFIHSIYEIYNELTENMIIFNGMFVNSRFMPFISKSFTQLFQPIGVIESFNPNDQQSSNRINKKIEQITHGKFKNIVPILNNLSRIVLINACYFNMTWEQGFDPYDTRVADFYTANGDSKQQKYMIQSNVFRYYENGSGQYCELPYQNTNYCFGVFLPKRGTSILTDYISKISAMRTSKVKIYLPKFAQRTNLPLISTFAKMGLKSLFDTRAAEIGGIISTPDVFVSDAVHECVFSTDEQGGEATTAIAKSPKSEEEQHVMRCDHTFLYYVRFVKYNLILLTGVFDG